MTKKEGHGNIGGVREKKLTDEEDPLLKERDEGHLEAGEYLEGA